MIDPAAQLSLLESRAAARDVHGLRVCALRLNVWLELSGRTALRGDLRWLRLAARAARDQEVLGRRGWAQIPAEEQQQAARTLETALAGARYRGLLRSLCALPPLDPRMAQRALPRMVTRMRRAAAAALAQSEDEQARHRLRRRARRLRYAYEWLGQPANELIALQEALGRSNDAAVALAHARAHRPQDEKLLTGLQREAAGDRSQLKDLLEAVERTLEDEG